MDTDLRHLVLDSPIGALTLVARGEVLSCLWMTDHQHLPDPEQFGRPVGVRHRGDILARAADQLGEYFAGERTEFELELDSAEGTAFQRRVWAALREIPYGETISYGELARRIGRPTAVRAVGRANGRNPISIVVPCHRVIGAGGKLTGYGGGLERKQMLLALEREHADRQQALPVGVR